MNSFTAEQKAILLNAQKTHKLVGVHKWDDDPDIFVVGFVAEIGEDEAEFWWVDSHGRTDEDDERSSVAYDRIVRLDVDTYYLRYLERLYQRADAVYADVKRPSNTKLPKRMEAALAAAKAAKEAVELVLIGVERPQRAFVAGVQGEIVKLRPISDEFGIDGIWLIRLNQIKSVKRGGDNLAATTHLFGART